MKTIYKSELKELADKEFDTVEALEAEEAKVNTEIAKKQELTAQRKADAEIVDSAIKNEVEVKKSIAEKKLALREQYIKDKQALDKKYLEDKQALDEEIDKAIEATTNALKDFCDKHKEGYHSTIKFDDGSTRTYSYSVQDKAKVAASLSDLIDTMFQPFWKW